MNANPATTRVPVPMNRAEQFAFARQAVLSQLRAMPDTLRILFGDRSTRTSAACELTDPPDGGLARQALELATAAYDRPLLNHCLRCWYLADLFAQLDGHTYDPEQLYVACVLHDIALTETHCPQGALACFATHGGEVAHRHLLAWGAGTGFAGTVRDAIDLHMNVRVTPGEGGVAHLVHEAAYLDVGGVRYRDLPLHAMAAVVRRYPRDGFRTTFLHAIHGEARRRPHSRAAVLWKAGLRIPVALNPLDRITGPAA